MTKSLSISLIILLLIGSVPSRLVAQQMTSRVVGTVLDGQCTPLRNARVTATTLTDTFLAGTVTNENGQYSLGNIARGQVRLTLEPRGSEFQRGSVVANVGPEGLDVNWVASRSFNAVPLVGTLIHPRGELRAATVAGKVLTNNGRVIPDLQVMLKSREGKVLNQAKTNAQGQYHLVSQTPGAYQLTLDTLKSGFLGNTALICAGSGTLAINWIVSTTADAVPTEDTDEPNVNGGLFGLGVFSAGATFMGIMAHALQSTPGRRVASPSQ